MIDALPLDKYELNGSRNKDKGAADEDDEAWAAAERSATSANKEQGLKRKRDKKDKGHRKEHRREEKKVKRKDK